MSPERQLTESINPMPEDDTKTQDVELLFGVIAEVEKYPKSLVLLDVPFGRLMDEIVVPYDNDDSFFIDGVPATKTTVRRIKIVELGQEYKHAMLDLDHGLTRGEAKDIKVYGDQYDTRFEHVLRTCTVDVTSQIISAYNRTIKPSIKEYLPKREELIGAAVKVFVEGMKTLSS